MVTPGITALRQLTMSPRRQGSRAIFTAEEADAHALTNFPFGDAGAEGFDAADYFVAGDARKLQAGIGAGYRGGVGVADAAGFDSDANLAGGGLGDGALYYFEDIWRGNFYCFVGAFQFSAPVASALALAIMRGFACYFCFG